MTHIRLFCLVALVLGAALLVEARPQKPTQPKTIPKRPMDKFPHFDTVTSGYGPEKYITVPGFSKDNGTHLWYWMFESRSNPATDPFVIWLTGGPGCASTVALFAENGPYIIGKDGSLSLNPNSWNSNATVMWIDQPVGTGFSYADHSRDYVVNEAQVAEDMYEFITQFMAGRPQYAKLPFFVTGESYAGHYIPAIGARIVSGNQAGGNVHIPLAGVAIGNGWVDPYHQYAMYAEFLYENKLLDYLSTVAYNNTAYPACEALISSGAWPVAFYECSLAMQGVLMEAEVEIGRTINVYDIRIPCEVPPLCYDFSNVANLLAKPDVRKALGVNPKARWEDCNMLVHTYLLGDWVGNLAVDLPTILSAGTRVLIYNGREDFVCNYRGADVWTANLQWNGQSQFNAAPQKNWNVNNKLAGYSKSALNFTYLTVIGAGHMVPMDQPVAALKMLNTFTAGTPF